MDESLSDNRHLLCAEHHACPTHRVPPAPITGTGILGVTRQWVPRKIQPSLIGRVLGAVELAQGHPGIKQQDQAPVLSSVTPPNLPSNCSQRKEDRIFLGQTFHFLH